MNSRDLQACGDAVREAEAQIKAILAGLVITLDGLCGTTHTVHAIAVNDDLSVAVCTCTVE